MRYELLDTGPMWFVEALLIFSVVHALWWRLSNRPAQRVGSDGAAPGNLAIVVFALGVGLITFVVRIWLPVGWCFAPLSFQFRHFPQYIALFIVGTIAYQRGWLSVISEDVTRGKLSGQALACLVFLAPILFAAGGAREGSTAAFSAGRANRHAKLQIHTCTSRWRGRPAC
jgi:hypothetical protein